jgi:hypothetical protein
VIPPGLLKGSFGCRNGPLAALALLLLPGFIPAALAVAPLLLLLECACGLAGRLVVDGLGRRFPLLRRRLCRRPLGVADGKVGRKLGVFAECAV